MYKLSSPTLQVQVVKDKQSGDVFAMKTLKKTQTLAQESVSTDIFNCLTVARLAKRVTQHSS